MPLKKGASNKIREHNIAEMINSGMDPKRAEAAGYRQQREAQAKAAAAHRKSSKGK